MEDTDTSYLKPATRHYVSILYQYELRIVVL